MPWVEVALVQMARLVVLMLIDEVETLRLGDELGMGVTVILYVEVTLLVTVVRTLRVGHGHSSVQGHVYVELFLEVVIGDVGKDLVVWSLAVTGEVR